jgi:MinD-like ATPase involved in chromosome partitioning or flagellar assembly/photosystem II stability/assembly factor-like uncharacterized protein
MLTKQKTEVIAFGSGKGGTGKTLIASSLGYALTFSGHKVLMIDADPATDGLSLFLLGQSGLDQIKEFEPRNTFIGLLEGYKRDGQLIYEPRRINRVGKDDHGITYEALISGRGLYGDEKFLAPAVPDLDNTIYRSAIKYLFEQLRASGEYAYVVVDTRGGFSFESTDVCALADSFIVITEPDVTSFYQDRNLVRRVSAAAAALQCTSVLRAIIVNRALETEGDGYLKLSKMEVSFRNELTREFPVTFNNTHPIPISLEALKAYKTQRIPYVSAPSSLFSFATLSAFADILRVVTSRWAEGHVQKWNELVTRVSDAVEQENERVRRVEHEKDEAEGELKQLREATTRQSDKLESLERELARGAASYDHETRRSESLLAGLRQDYEKQIAELRRDYDLKYSALREERDKQESMSQQKAEERYRQLRKSRVVGLVVLALAASIGLAMAISVISNLKAETAALKHQQFVLRATKAWLVQNSGISDNISSIVGNSAGTEMWAVGRVYLLFYTEQNRRWQSRLLPPVLESKWQERSGSSVFGNSGLTELWIVGDPGTIWRFTPEGDKWKSEYTGAKTQLVSIAGTRDGSQLWAVGDAGVIVHYTSRTGQWELMNSGTLSDLLSVFASDNGEEVWAVGASGVILHYSARTARWESQGSTVTRNNLSCIFGAGDGSQVWAVGNSGIIMRYSAETQKWQPEDSGTSSSLSYISGSSNGSQLWAVGPNGLIIHYSASNRQWVRERSPVPWDLSTVFSSADGAQVWISGAYGTILLYTTHDPVAINEQP